MDEAKNKTGQEKHEAFTRELAVVINKHGVDSELGIPDYILCVYVTNTLLSLRQAQMMMKDFYESTSEIFDGPKPDVN
jgi:hypothetical protein